MRISSLTKLSICAVLVANVGCTEDTPEADPPAATCDQPASTLTTAEGVEYVRTPDACFDALPDWPYAPEYVEIDGLRQAYVDEGPRDGPVVLLLHGQPSWSYLYRKMVPVLVADGYRVIAMDHLGMGRSDKPTDIASYSYLGHVDRLERFIELLGLTDINVFVQDWGSLIGLRVVGTHPDWFARVAIGDGTLPVIPAGVQPYPPVENPNEIDDTLTSALSMIPAQQVPFYDECTPLGGPSDGFGAWMIYAMKAAAFRPSEIVEGLTWFDLPAAEEAAYDAPFPSRIYMAGVRVFPSLVNDLAGVNDEAYAGLTAFERPVLTIWAANDPGNLGQCETQEALIRDIRGAAGQPHARLPEASHFLQDDQGPEIARRLVEFFRSPTLDLGEPLGRGSRYCEILLVGMTGGAVEAEVWGTQGLSDCPSASWDALDATAIQNDTGALAVVLNGPRFWLPNRTTGALPRPERQTFGDLEMRLLAVVEVDPSQTSSAAYAEAIVRRTTTYTFDARAEIYELTTPDDETYVMQSMSQILDPTQSLDDLSGLATRLTPPAGWRYTARTLDAPLIMSTDGEAIVIQDDLGNTYQRLTPAEPDPTLPILPDGTGTPCTDDAACQGLDASHCLKGGSGPGFCTIEGCAAGACGTPYLCCYGCSPAAAALLPFEDSACIPEPAAVQLSSAAGCTCD